VNDRQIFGAYLKEKRNERVITLRALAGMIGVGYGYYSDLESGRRTPIDLAFLDKIKTALGLSDSDSRTLYDLAGKAREAAPPDLTVYLNGSEKARYALRLAKEVGTDEDWDEMIGKFEKRR
jgi:transcriptional regulator with XRE-family HTH domain